MKAAPPGRRGRASLLVAVLLFAVGLGAFGFAGWYVVQAQAPAPLPTASFEASGPASPGREEAPPLGPNALGIPSLSVRAGMDALGVSNGELRLPEPSRVTLYDAGAKPGSAEGTVLVAGHVNSRTLGRGALYQLAEIRPNAAIWVTDGAGRAYEYQVVRLSSQVKTALPQSIFTATGPARLVLVTCGGRILDTPQGRFYESNVIVEARPTGRSA